MLCNDHLLFNKISSSYRYKETVSFLNGWLAPLFQSAMVAAKKIRNPPTLAPDDLVMAYKDIRQFGDPVTEVLRYSDAPLNVNFHLRWVCVRTRYLNFNYTWLDVPLQMQQSLSPLHSQRLLSEFYWRP